jgi:hypothetical protein
MFDRKKFTWEVKLQDEQGTVAKRQISNYWDPDWKGTSWDCPDAIKLSAAIEAWYASKKTKKFVPTNESPKLLTS